MTSSWPAPTSCAPPGNSSLAQPLIHPSAVIDPAPSWTRGGGRPLLRHRCQGCASRPAPASAPMPWCGVRATSGGTTGSSSSPRVGEDPQDKKYRRGGDAAGDGRPQRGARVRHHPPRHRPGRGRHPHRQRQPVHGLHPCGPRLPHRRPCHHGQCRLTGGACRIQDWAILGGFTIVHQFCRIGAHSFCAMGSAVTKDVPTYVTVGGHPAEPRGINSEGLKRRGFSDEAVTLIRRAYRRSTGPTSSSPRPWSRCAALADTCPELVPLVEFVAGQHPQYRALMLTDRHRRQRGLRRSARGGASCANSRPWPRGCGFVGVAGPAHARGRVRDPGGDGASVGDGAHRGPRAPAGTARDPPRCWRGTSSPIGPTSSSASMPRTSIWAWSGACARPASPRCTWSRRRSGPGARGGSRSSAARWTCCSASSPSRRPSCARHGVPARYVGHPLADEIPLQSDRRAPAPPSACRRQGPIVAILPGSRVGEVEALAGPFIQAALPVSADAPGAALRCAPGQPPAAAHLRGDRGAGGPWAPDHTGRRAQP